MKNLSRQERKELEQGQKEKQVIEAARNAALHAVSNKEYEDAIELYKFSIYPTPGVPSRDQAACRGVLLLY